MFTVLTMIDINLLKEKILDSFHWSFFQWIHNKVFIALFFQVDACWRMCLSLEVQDFDFICFMLSIIHFPTKGNLFLNLMTVLMFEICGKCFIQFLNFIFAFLFHLQKNVAKMKIYLISLDFLDSNQNYHIQSNKRSFVQYLNPNLKFLYIFSFYLEKRIVLYNNY